MKLGKEFIEARRVKLIRNKAKKIERLKTEPFIGDLFGWAQKERHDKIMELQGDIEKLENGEVIFPVLRDYINDLKKWI